MNYSGLSNKEFAVFAEQDPRYGVDPLYTALAVRVSGNTNTPHGHVMQSLTTCSNTRQKGGAYDEN